VEVAWQLLQLPHLVVWVIYSVCRVELDLLLDMLLLKL
jgi:hypothetical protein